MTTKEILKLHVRLNGAHLDYREMLLRYAFFKTNDKQASEDLVHETFTKTWIYLVRKGKIDHLQAFLYHILKNLVIDQYRKKKSISLDYLLSKNFEAQVRDPVKIADIIDGRAAMLLINHLPKKYRQVMQMRYAQDLSLEEIHSITGQSKNSLAVQAHRGLAKLKKLYIH